MSADNWVICPRCHIEATNASAEAFLRAAEAYGKVSADEYRKLRATAQESIELEETLREDYEFCLDEEGEFYASFRARCSNCDFPFTFKHEEKVQV